MKTVTQHIRSRIEPHQMSSIDELRKTEWSKEFELLMRNRLVLGGMRYGRIKDQHERGTGLVGAIHRRMERYLRTGNLEMLVDVANLAMLEFLNPSHSKAHFAPVDDGEHD